MRGDTCGPCFFGAHDQCAGCRCAEVDHCTSIERYRGSLPELATPVAQEIPPEDGVYNEPRPDLVRPFAGMTAVGAWETTTVQDGKVVREEIRVRFRR